MSSTSGDAVKELKSLKTNVKLLKLVVLGVGRGKKGKKLVVVMIKLKA
jgi:hypothetical protein